jgi:hypothetical protein
MNIDIKNPKNRVLVILFIFKIKMRLIFNISKKDELAIFYSCKIELNGTPS